MTVKKVFEKQILKIGTFKHPKAPEGELKVTRGYLDRILENFKKSPFAPVKRGHVSNEEAEQNSALLVNKNTKSLKVKDDGLYAELEMDEKELDRYNDVSCEIDPNGEDHETGEKGPYLRGIALTMDPFIKGMKPFEALDIKMSDKADNFIVNLSEITKMDKTKKPVEAEKETEEKVVDTETKVEDKPEAEVTTPETEDKAEVKEEVKEEEVKKEETSEVKASELQARIVELEEKLHTQEVETKLKDAEVTFNTLLSEGKVVPAQKDTFIALSTTSNDVIKLSDGKSADVAELIKSLYENAPKVIEFGEKGKADTDKNPNEDKLKLELRERRSDMSDKDFEKWWDNHSATAKKAVGIKDEK